VVAARIAVVQLDSVKPVVVGAKWSIFPLAVGVLVAAQLVVNKVAAA
jgi:hypothetical protein